MIHVRRRLFSSVLLAAIAAGLVFGVASPAQGATLCVNPGGTVGCFSTIQGAINAAANMGDTITVAAGTYNESKVLVDKSVTITGAGPGQTILDGQNIAPTGSGLLQVQTIFGNVTISGMTIRNAGLNGGRYAIFEKAQVPNQTYTFENLAIEGVGANFDNGLYSYNSQSNLILRSSTITGTGGNPVLVEQHSGPLDIDGNQITGSATTGSSIFVMTYGNVNVTTTQRVRNNTINVRGVTFNGAFSNIAGTGTFTDVRVTDNVITGVILGSGVSLTNGDTDAGGAEGVISDAQVLGNTLTGTGVAGTRGISHTGNVTGTRVSANDITNFEIGLNAAVNSGGGPSGTEAEGNRFVGNTLAGLNNGTTNALLAENNWWGCNTGPGTAGCDAATGAALDTNPWLVLSATVAPDTLPVGTTATATASIRTNSDDDLYGDRLFAGHSIGFSTDRGTIAPASVPLTNPDGSASSTLSGGNVPGTGTVSATLDSATATAPFRVVGNAPPPPPPPPPPSPPCSGQEVTVRLDLDQSPTNGPDVIRGTPDDDVINALGGDDVICGGGGNDIISGNQGLDRMFGGGGDDEMRGNAGNDILRGRAGDDLLYGQAGDDTLDGGSDTDTCRGGTGVDTATACETTIGVP